MAWLMSSNLCQIPSCLPGPSFRYAIYRLQVLQAHAWCPCRSEYLQAIKFRLMSVSDCGIYQCFEILFNDYLCSCPNLQRQYCVFDLRVMKNQRGPYQYYHEHRVDNQLGGFESSVPITCLHFVILVNSNPADSDV